VSGRGNVEAILEANNERSASLYLDGLLNTMTNIDAYRPTERKLISTTSTQDARSSGCT
jgi:hypothetical protein